MESINIKEVLQELQSAHAGSFERLYDHLVDRVFAFVAYRTRDKSAALEITQDSFVELHQALGRFRYQSDAAFYAFVFTIVRRQLARHYRECKKHTHDNDEGIDQVAHHDQTEATAAVYAALEQLDETAREIVVLHHWSRYTFAEIAHLINMTESAVRVRHHRARATLAALLTS